jgi:sarcosine oxidase subunit alpha
MCREDGMVFDDGVVARLAERRFLLTTTTGGAARVHDWLEEWHQTEWPGLEVYVTAVTEQWAAVALAGPRTFELLRELAPALPLDGAAFRRLAVRDAAVAGLPARIWRVGFTAEPGCEIHVAAHHGPALWQAVMDAGGRHGATAFGTQAMHLLRAERGLIIVGQETDGSVTPLDLGLTRLVARGKDFIGRRSLDRPDTARVDRKQLVGLLPDDPDFVLPEGAALVERPGGRPPVPILGHVTSSYWSPHLGRSFALALIKSGRQRIGAKLFAPTEEHVAAVRVAALPFVDGDGSVRHG